MNGYPGPEDEVEINSTAARFPLPSCDIADRLIELLVPVDYVATRTDGAA